MTRIYESKAARGIVYYSEATRLPLLIVFTTLAGTPTATLQLGLNHLQGSFLYQLWYILIIVL